MKVANVHKRSFKASPKAVGALIDSLSSNKDIVWPHEKWPKLKLSEGLCINSVGGHGPVRYYVEEYEPSKRVKFRFADKTTTFASGLSGYHCFELVEANSDSGNQEVVLMHSLVGEISGWMYIKWPIMVRPLHDALIEDSLDKAARVLGEEPKHPARWSYWVTFLRTLASIFM